MENQLGNTTKKRKFVLLTFLVVVGRAFDATTTYLYTPDLTSETNVLVKFLGANWTSIIAVQVLLTGLIIGLLYFYFFKFSPHKPGVKNLTLKQYISHLYFNDTKSFNKLLYKLPTDKTVLIASTGYIASMTLMSISYIVGTSTTLLLLSDSYKQLYKQGIPYLLYLMIAGLAFWFTVHFFKTAYKKYQCEF